MNWYKIAKFEYHGPVIETFQDRNKLNERIRAFKKMAEELATLREYIPQNPPDAQKRIKLILQDKMTSSYPDLRKALETAVKKARDNYQEFAAMCDFALEQVYNIIKMLEKARYIFVHKKAPEAVKQLRERKAK